MPFERVTFCLLCLNVVIFVDGRKFMTVIVVLMCLIILKQLLLMMSALTFSPTVSV